MMSELFPIVILDLGLVNKYCLLWVLNVFKIKSVKLKCSSYTHPDLYQLLPGGTAINSIVGRFVTTDTYTFSALIFFVHRCMRKPLPLLKIMYTTDLIFP